MSRYAPQQSLNSWVGMLDDIYGNSQNYSKSAFEIHAHLTEVSGALVRILLKKRDISNAIPFAAKTFAWAVALLTKVKQQNSFEEVLLRKFPGICPYCQCTRCSCWQSPKPDLDEAKLRAAYYGYAPSMPRSVNDFQLMLQRIYEDSWGEDSEILQLIGNRLYEELAEVAEAMRFVHLYPNNFQNEVADFMAWWFALVSTMHRLEKGRSPLLAEHVLWSQYPGYCNACRLRPCLCRPGPVRELISKPIPGESDRLDRLTLVFNQSAFIDDQKDIFDETMPVTYPLSATRVDIDYFKRINDEFGHAAGDRTLKHVASIMRLKARERDRLYRAGGDEFVMLSADSSKEESLGTMRRIVSELSRSPVRWVTDDGNPHEIAVTLSIGIAESADKAELVSMLKAADDAAYRSKANGRNQITVAD